MRAHHMALPLDTVGSLPRGKSRKCTIDTAPLSVAPSPSLLVTPQSQTLRPIDDSSAGLRRIEEPLGDIGTRDERRDDDYCRGGGRGSSYNGGGRFVSDFDTPPPSVAAGSEATATPEARRMGQNDVDYYYGRSSRRERVDTGRTARSSVGTFVTARTHRSPPPVMPDRGGAQHRGGFVADDGAEDSTMRGDSIEGASEGERIGSFDVVGGKIRMSPSGIEVGGTDEEEGSVGFAGSTSAAVVGLVRSPQSAFRLSVRATGEGTSFVAPTSDYATYARGTDTQHASTYAEDSGLRCLYNDEVHRCDDAREEVATKEVPVRSTAEERSDAHAAYNEGEGHRVLLDARPSSTQTIWKNLQSWWGGGFSFCATPRGAVDQMSSDDNDSPNEDDIRNPYGGATGDGRRGNAKAAYGTPARGGAGVFNFVEDGDDDDGDTRTDRSRTARTRNGRADAADRRQDESPLHFQRGADHTKTVKRRNGRTAAADVPGNDGLQRPSVPIAVVDDADSCERSKRVQRAQAMRDPALLTGTHYLGWDGRRSHYTVLSDQTDLLFASPDGRRGWDVDGGDGRARAADRDTERRGVDVNAPYWQSPEAQEKLGNAAAVVHVVPSPRSSRGGAPSATLRPISSAEHFDPPRSPVEEQILNNFLSYSDDELPYFGSVEGDQSHPSPGRKKAADRMEMQLRSEAQLRSSICSGSAGGRPPLPILSRQTLSPAPSLNNVPNRARANTGNSISTRGTARTKATQASYHRRAASIVSFDADTLSRICAVDGEEPVADREKGRVPREGGMATPSPHRGESAAGNKSNSSIRNIGELNIDRDESDVSPIEDDFSPLTMSTKKQVRNGNVPAYEEGMHCTPVRRSEHHLPRRQNDKSEDRKHFFQQNNGGVNSNLFGTTLAEAQRDDEIDISSRDPPTIPRQQSDTPPRTVTAHFSAPKQAKMSPVRDLKSHLLPPRKKTPMHRSKSPSRKSKTPARKGKTPSRSRSKTPSQRQRDFAMNRESEMYLPRSAVFKSDLRASGRRGNCLFEGWVALSKGDRLLRSLVSSVSSSTLKREDFRYVMIMSDAPHLHMFSSTSKKGECSLNGGVASLDLSHNVAVGTVLVSKKYGHCVVIRDKTTSKPLCTLLPTTIRPCFFSDKAQSRLIGQKKFEKISELLFLPLLPEERDWETNRRSKHEALEVAMPHLHRRSGSEWGDPENILEFAPPAQLDAAMHTLFAIDLVIKAA